MSKLDLKYLFPTPMWTTKLEGYGILNQKLQKYIYSLKEKDPKGEIYSNVLGWSSGDLREWHTLGVEIKSHGEEIEDFLNKINPHIAKALLDLGCDLVNLQPNINEMWSVINPEHATMITHIHPESVLSIAYYVKAKGNCGNFVADDPRVGSQFKVPPTYNSNILNLRKIEVEPEEGLLVIFPSYLPHFVGPNRTKEDRIVISMNIDLIPKT